MNFKKIPSENGRKIDDPKYATTGSACFDLTANVDENITILPDETVKIRTGIAIEIENSGLVGLVFPRSGLASKHGITLANSVGVIDSDYRGEIMVPVKNTSKISYEINSGDRIAQLGIFPVFMQTFTECDELSDTVRGVGGFGSTGK